MIISKLTKSCFNNNFEEVAKYLKMGADINGIDENLDTPLSSAIQGCCKEMMIYLLEKGADPNKVCGVSDISPIYWVADGELDQFYDTSEVGEDFCSMIEILLKYGADINIKDKYNQTVLDFAISYKNPKAQALLRDLGAKTSKDLD